MPRRWDENAELRARQIESGLDLTFSRVFVPYFVEHVRALRPSNILEVGGGTGHLSRALAPNVNRLVMLEPSERMCKIARETLGKLSVEVHQQTIEQFRSSSRETFELVISHLCLQIVSDLSVFVRSLAATLAPTGTFLLSLPHPAFYNDYKRFFPPETFRYSVEASATVEWSITLDPEHRISGVPYHHRPIETYIRSLSDENLGVTVFAEVFPEAEIQALYGEPWINPRYLVLGGRHLNR